MFTEKFLRTTRSLLLILKWHVNFHFVLSVHSILDSECLVQQKREFGAGERTNKAGICSANMSNLAYWQCIGWYDF